jgi:hypothetical protein
VGSHANASAGIRAKIARNFFIFGILVLKFHAIY